MITIYKHTAPNGKVYVGQTSQPLHRRWRGGEGYATNPHFYRAIKKYGWDTIAHETICTCATQEEANLVEQHYIQLYDSANPAHGYNQEETVDGIRVRSEESRKRASEIRKGKFAGSKNPNYGRKHTPEERQRMSEALKGKYRGLLSPRYGAKASAEARANMSAARKKSPLVQEHMREMNAAKAKRVLCVETGEIYPSAHEVARRTGHSQGCISAACRAENGRAYGLHWKYI